MNCTGMMCFALRGGQMTGASGAGDTSADLHAAGFHLSKRRIDHTYPASDLICQRHDDLAVSRKSGPGAKRFDNVGLASPIRAAQDRKSTEGNLSVAHGLVMGDNYADEHSTSHFLGRRRETRYRSCLISGSRLGQADLSQSGALTKSSLVEVPPNIRSCRCPARHSVRSCR